nr:unnamed protein product [Callosobruchus analis]
MHGFDHGFDLQTPILNLPFFVDEPQLCVASTLVRYLNVTKGLKNWCDWLLIASKKSHRKASTSTITRWIKGMLESSGLEMFIFKPQSTRHASRPQELGLVLSVQQLVGLTIPEQTFKPVLVDIYQFSKVILSLSCNIFYSFGCFWRSSLGTQNSSC